MAFILVENKKLDADTLVGSGVSIPENKKATCSPLLFLNPFSGESLFIFSKPVIRRNKEQRRRKD